MQVRLQQLQTLFLFNTLLIGWRVRVRWFQRLQRIILLKQTWIYFCSIWTSRLLLITWWLTAALLRRWLSERSFYCASRHTAKDVRETTDLPVKKAPEIVQTQSVWDQGELSSLFILPLKKSNKIFENWLLNSIDKHSSFTLLLVYNLDKRWAD